MPGRRDNTDMTASGSPDHVEVEEVEEIDSTTNQQSSSESRESRTLRYARFWIGLDDLFAAERARRGFAGESANENAQNAATLHINIDQTASSAGDCTNCQRLRKENDNLKAERVRLLQTIIDLEKEVIMVPPHWSALEEVQTVKLFPLSPEDAEYKRVMEIGGVNLAHLSNYISQISRIQNVGLYKLFELKSQLKDKLNGQLLQTRRYLWHGTMLQAVERIVVYGFDRGHSGKNGTALGKGTYYATDIATSVMYSTVTTTGQTATCKILLCEVYTGRFCDGGYESLVEAPSLPSGQRADSVVDSLTAPAMFCLFEDHSSYPAYEITFVDNY